MVLNSLVWAQLVLYPCSFNQLDMVKVLDLSHLARIMLDGVGWLVLETAGLISLASLKLSSA